MIAAPKGFTLSSLSTGGVLRVAGGCVLGIQHEATERY